MHHAGSFLSTNTCSFFALLAALGGSLGTVACGSVSERGDALAEVGTLSAPLTATGSRGFEYRLRSAVLSVAGPTPATIDSEDYLDQPAVDITLSAGAYTIALAPGWALEREQDGAFVPVEATLASDELQSFTIIANQRSTVVFKFQVGDEVIEVGEGGLGVVLDVSDAPEVPAVPEVPDGAPEASPLLTSQWALWAPNIGYDAKGGTVCAMRADRVVACSDGSQPLSQVVKQVSGDGSVICGISDSVVGHLECSTVSGWPAPPAGDYFLQVSVGFGPICATDGLDITCWGGAGWTHPSLESDTGPYSAQMVAAGGNQTCGLFDDGLPLCWGARHDAPYRHLVSLSSGVDHTCGIGSDRTVICWGSNYEGQIDAPEGAFLQVWAGSDNSCGVRADHSIACWGSDENGQSSPPSGNDFVDVQGSVTYSGDPYWCAQRRSGSFKCWGAFSNEIDADFLSVPVPPLVTAAQAGPWTAIVPVMLNEDEYTDLLYYDSATGRAVYAAGTATPGVENVVLETSYAPGWTDVVPASHSEESTLTDLTFYDSVTGNYSAMLATATPGVQTELYSGTGTPGAMVVPMATDADSLTDALWYDPITGKGILSASTGPSNEVMMGAGWTTILPVHLNSDPDTDLLFYNRTTGAVSLSVSTGPATQTHLADGSFGPGWTTLVPINLNGDHFTDVMRYDASSGKTVYTAVFAWGKLVDVLATQTPPGQTLFAPMQNYRDRSKNFVATFGSAPAP